MGKRQDSELEAIRLYAAGKEIPAIAAELGVSENSLRKWKSRAGTEWQDVRRAARQSQLVSIEDVGSRLRRSSEIATKMAGSAKDQGTVGLILNQSLQTMIYDVMEKIDTMNVDPDEIGRVTKMINTLTLAHGRTEQAGSINLKREAEIRKQTLAEAIKAVDEVAATGKKGGLSDEAANEIRRKILGIGA